jgi:hypothetical protein
MDAKSRLLVVAVVVAASAACLPRGNPPAGRQLVADSTASLGAMVPPNGDGVLRVLFMRPSVQDSTGSDLFEVSLDPDGQQSPERLLVSDIENDDDLGCLWKVAPCSFDKKGRIFVLKKLPPDYVPEPGSFGPPALLVDPITGDIEKASIGPTFGAYTSDSGKRSLTYDDSAETSATVTEADGRTTVIQLFPAPPGTRFSPRPQWVGEDLYYVDAQSDLIDLPPSVVPQQLATGIEDFMAWPTPDGGLLELIRATADPMVQQVSIRDPATGQETPTPFDGNGTITFSSDWRWLLYSEFTYSEASGTETDRNTLFDYHSGATQVLDFGTYVNAQWRPGHDELWVGVPGNNPTPTFWVVTPGGPTITVEGVYFEGLTPDGTYWFATHDANVTAPTLEIGVADDPTGPRVPYNPPGTNFQNQWTLPDGRWLEAVYVKDIQRADVIAVDPGTGHSQLLAERGRIAALGQTQFIGMFHFEGGRGDLTAVNLASGQSTVLAPEFTVTAFAEPQGADLVAPGARIVYQFQARTASPYDGIWLANAP